MLRLGGSIRLSLTKYSCVELHHTYSSLYECVILTNLAVLDLMMKVSFILCYTVVCGLGFKGHECVLGPLEG